MEEKRVRVVRIPERWEICEEGVGGYWCEHPCVCLVVQDETKHEAAPGHSRAWRRHILSRQVIGELYSTVLRYRAQPQRRGLALARLSVRGLGLGFKTVRRILLLRGSSLSYRWFLRSRASSKLS